MASQHPARPTDDAQSAAPPFEDLVSDALAAAATMRGWDFGYLRGRTSGDDLSWSYNHLAREAIAHAASLLDLDTGGGELLASLRPLPPHTVATESWAPNVLVARERLEPLGVDVRTSETGRLPVADGEFEVILARHAALDVDELWRVSAPGGMILTQQAGSRNDMELNAALGAALSIDPDSHTCATTVAALEKRGFQILHAREEFPAYHFHDVAAVVYQLSVVSWTIPDFDVRRYETRLRQLDARIRAEGPLVTHNHRFAIKARRPAARA
ncbi:methyltransferase domain-containing protein [Actinopolymorpha alba]|uniref:methyltransferase domain-containing protein n=1 Tax=Actinopolymorpha alba TaxID=533267 RepID=UPI00036AFA15|nr:methyltransferase domain-containing protein [Actinopolymorpha alba]